MFNKSRVSTHRFMILLVVFLLVVSIKGAITPQGNQMIREAIKAAIKDGLNIIDVDLRTTYWYYLKGAQLTSYNYTLLDDAVNYIIIYENLGNTFKVNCDLIKRTFLPSLNSFVRISSITPTIDQGKTTNQTLDLTNLQNFNKTVLTRAAATTIVSPPIVIVDNSKDSSLTINGPKGG